MAEILGKICWLVDTKGWAFENRAKAISRMLPDYEHEVAVLGPDSMINFDDFDIIVCDFLPWMKFIGGERDKVVLGMRSFRALKAYEAVPERRHRGIA